MLSGNAIKRLGKRLRDGIASRPDYDLLDEYRSEFDELLLSSAQVISDELAGRVKFLMTGRMKRTKSIIRKLARERNTGMDLSRMSDLVGLRLVTRTLGEQDLVLDKLCNILPQVRDPYDYRDRDKGYRAIHLISGTSTHRVEVQLRTTAQHLWADESERLGEQVKEGVMDSAVSKYLGDLSLFSRTLESCQHETNEIEERYPEWSAAYHLLNAQFERVTATTAGDFGASFVVVYHQPTNELVRVERFSSSGRAQAVGYFRRMSRELDDNIYDILVLNSPSREALTVTHPRYFPNKP